MCEIDDWTLHCVESEIKRLRSFNEEMRTDAINRKDEVRYLIFENRVLVLIELQTKIQQLKILEKVMGNE